MKIIAQHDFSKEMIAPIAIVVASLITLLLLLIALAHVAGRKDIIRTQKFIRSGLLLFILPIYFYCFKFIKTPAVKIIAVITPFILIIGLYHFLRPVNYDKILAHTPRDAMTVEERRIKDTLPEDALPQGNKNLHQIIARVNIIYGSCDFENTYYADFMNHSEEFLFEDVQYLLRNTEFSFSEAEDMIRNYRDYFKLRFTPPTSNIRAFCSSRHANMLEDFYEHFSLNPEKVKEDMDVVNPDGARHSGPEPD